MAEAIDRARLSVYAAVFNLSLDSVRDALIRAHRRGVDVRLVTDSDSLDRYDVQRLVESGIPVVGDGRNGTMHNKFMVIDGIESWTGSMNFTTSGAYQDHNTLIRIQSAELARDYEAEFAEMFEQGLFGPAGGASTPIPRLTIEGTFVEVWFSPDDSVEQGLVNLLDTAQMEIAFLAFSFTSDPLAEAVLRAHDAGIVVRGVMDADQAVSNIGGEYQAFRSAGLDVLLDGNEGQMHEKVLILDGELVVLGSYNFSRNASETNDENLLIIHDHPIAAEFLKEFDRVYASAER